MQTGIEQVRDDAAREVISTGRLLAMAAAAAVAFVAGFYAGLIAVLIVVGFDSIAAVPFELATVAPGGLFAGAAAAGASPFSLRRVAGYAVGATTVACALAGVALLGFDSGYDIAIMVGGGVALVVATVATVRAGRRG